MRILSVLSVALLALPVSAQEPVVTKATGQEVNAEQAELNFFKAFYIERVERRGTEAVALYKKFLDASASSGYAPKAAAYAYGILLRANKDEAEAFKTKYSATVKNVDWTGTPEAAGDPGMGRGMRQGGAGMPNLDDLHKQLEKAKADKDEAKQKELEAEIKRIEDAQARGRGQGGGQGQGGNRRGGMNQKPITEMTDEELGTFQQQGMQFMTTRITRLRDSGQGEVADKADALVKKIKDNLTAGKKKEAEDARQELVKLLPAGRGRGGL